MTSIILILTCVFVLCRAGTLFDEELYRSALDEELCIRQLETMGTFGFYDASFHVPQQLLKGSFEDYYGNFYQCLAIDQNFHNRKLEGKYCTIRTTLTYPTSRIPLLGGVSESSNVTWTELTFNWAKNGSDIIFSDTVFSSDATRPANAVTLSLGLCVPKTCTVDAVLRPYVEHPAVRFNYSEEFCRVPGDVPFTAVDYIGLAVFSLLGILTILSTAYEIHYLFISHKDAAAASELLRAFSLYTNTSRMFTFQETKRPLDCLEGIRALSVLWIIIFHTNYLISITAFENIGLSEIRLAIENIIITRFNVSITSGRFAVDSFFVLSGLLLVYSTASKVKQLTMESLPLFYLNRYMRLFPQLATAVLLRLSVLHHVADGPEELRTDEVESCRRYWWSAFLHMQNIINKTDTCLGQTWYLSVDMQLYIVSPLVLYWVLRSPRAAWAALVTAIFASLTGIVAICSFTSCDNYRNTVTRSPPFFMGMLVGYLLHVHRRDKLRLSKMTVFVCYCLALVLSSVAIFDLLTLGYDNEVATSIYLALHRSCWSLALCWLILACAHGYGGPVNWFLSLKVWRVIARFSYSMYMFSWSIQKSLLSSDVQYYFDTRTLLSRFGSDLMFTLVISVAACVLVEAPVVTLYSLLLNRTRVAASKEDITEVVSHINNCSPRLAVEQTRI